MTRPALAALLLQCAFWLALIAWITVMPSIGVLYLLGWMR